MNKIIRVLSFCLLLACLQCARSLVLVDSDMYGTFDLSKYQTFDFVQIDADKTGSPAFEQNIRYLPQAIA
ncbi:MAG: hypothetical protein R6V72_19615 [Cyclobacterium sp.]|uniref:hypothetical protein n=1 Tax=Cyclobacterium sp. TaxID=1966343 RepID=UPI00397090FC